MSWVFCFSLCFSVFGFSKRHQVACFMCIVKRASICVATKNEFSVLLWHFNAFFFFSGTFALSICTKYQRDKKPGTTNELWNVSKRFSKLVQNSSIIIRKRIVLSINEEWWSLVTLFLFIQQFARVVSFLFLPPLSLSSFWVFYCTLQIAHKLQRRNRRNGKRACAYTIIISL